MKKSVLVPLAEGFEEIEAVAIIDVLRRAGVEVILASLDGAEVAGAHGIVIRAEAGLADCAGREFDMIVLPGGAVGARNLAASGVLEAIVARQHAAGKGIGAICAAPAVVLEPFGVLPEAPVACYPSFQSRLKAGQRSDLRVAVNGNLTTGAGPGAALEFALELVRGLVGADKAAELARGMLVPAA